MLHVEILFPPHSYLYIPELSMPEFMQAFWTCVSLEKMMAHIYGRSVIQGVQMRPTCVDEGHPIGLAHPYVPWHGKWQVQVHTWASEGVRAARLRISHVGGCSTHVKVPVSQMEAIGRRP